MLQSGPKHLWLVLAAIFLLCGCGNNSTMSSPASPTPSSPTPQAVTAQFSYPSDGATNVDPFHAFTWEAISGADGYTVHIGTFPGGKDIYSSDQVTSEVTSVFVSGILPSQKYYARLWTVQGQNWTYVDTVFQTGATTVNYSSADLFTTVKKLTGDVRTSAPLTNIPVSGSPLAAEVALRGRYSASCVDFANTLLQQLAQNKIFGRKQTITLLGNSIVSHTTSEYFDPNTSHWTVADATFGLVYYDAAKGIGKSAGELSDIVARMTWSEVPFVLVTSNGQLYANAYYLDPITLYFFVLPAGGGVSGDLPTSPLPYLDLVPPSQYGMQGFYVFNVPANAENVTLVNPPGTKTSVTGTFSLDPLDGTSWSSAFTLNDGWQLNGSSSSMVQAYTFRRFLF